jgi:hypothetical protein
MSRLLTGHPVQGFLNMFWHQNAEHWPGINWRHQAGINISAASRLFPTNRRDKWYDKQVLEKF